MRGKSDDVYHVNEDHLNNGKIRAIREYITCWGSSTFSRKPSGVVMTVFLTRGYVVK